MKELIRFTVRQKLFNITTLLINLILLAVIGVSLFADVLFVSPNNPVTVSLNSSTAFLYPYLAERSEVEYQISEKPVCADNAILLYDGGFVLMTSGSVKNIENQVRRDLKEALRERYAEKGDLLTNEYLKELEELENISVSEKKEEENTVYLTAAATAFYFLLSSLSSLAAADVSYDRSTGNLEMILSSLNPGQYLKARMAAGWMSFLIQASLAAGYLLVFTVIRFSYDGFTGIRIGFSVSMNAVKPGILSIVLMIMLMGSELLISQLMMVFVTLRAEKSSGHNQRVILFQAALMCLYYLSIHFSDKIMNFRLAVLIPFVNSVRECALLLEGKTRLLPVIIILVENAVILFSGGMIIERFCFKKISE